MSDPRTPRLVRQLGQAVEVLSLRWWRAPARRHELHALSRADYRSIAMMAAAAWLLTRILYVGITYFAVSLANPGAHYHPDPPSSPQAILGAWKQWDTGWYSTIVQHGYTTEPTAAFFPLYPLLVRGATEVTGGNLLVAELVVSNLATLLAFFAIGVLTAAELGAAYVPAVLRAVAAYPLAFFTFAGYSDSTLLLLAAATMLWARRGNWGRAALGGLFAGLARPFGVVLATTVAVEAWRLRAALRQRQLEMIKAALAVAAAPLALAGWAVCLWRIFGDPAVFLKVQWVQWGHQTVPPWEGVRLAVQALGRTAWTFNQAHLLTDLLPLLFFAAVTLVAARRMPAGHLLYMVALLLSLLMVVKPFDPDPVASAGRYLLVAIPAFLVLGRWMASSALADLGWTAAGFMLQALFAAYFLRGGFIV